MPDLGHRITLVELLDRCQRVEVPQLQRDYAQGRETAKEVRDAFLDALQGALLCPRDDESLPLNLDFVYGSMEENNGKFFLPLDGQQRLTTLFLLHWYLAWRDDELNSFREIFWNGRHSRFSYAVRPSSAEFFDELVQYFPECSPSDVRSVRRLLENQHWFYMHWRLDPTIQSCLTMMDAIHARFQKHKGVFQRFLDNECPAITFQLLPLEHFGLSDDLYIKMNARGKPLTAFETFKARFEQHLEQLYPTETRKIGEATLPVHDFFSRRIDTRWTDFFWSHRTPSASVFDQAVMNLFWILAWASIDPDSRPSGASVVRYRQSVGSFSEFDEHGLLTRSFADNLICLLEAWSSGGGQLQPQLADTRYFDEAAFFEKTSKSPLSVQYGELVMFAAFSFYLSFNEGGVAPEDLQQWMRVVFNLVHNSDIERPDDYERSVTGLRKLLPHSREILQHIAAVETGPLGFSRDQVQEESLKAELLLANSNWEERIHAAEAHGYFRGQIGFLIDFSGIRDLADEHPVEEWTDDQHTELQQKFDDYLEKAKAMFDARGLADLPGEEYQWERSLLAVGNYFMRLGRNRSFLTNPASSPDGWKRFLRSGTGRSYLKALWDRLDLSLGLAKQLAEIRNGAELEPWRAAMIGSPQAMSYCGQHQIRWEEGADEIYLLKRKQMNGAHAELFSYVLDRELRTESRTKELAPLRVEPYEFVTMTDFEPHVCLAWGNASLSIKSDRGKFQITIYQFALKEMPAAQEYLTDSLGFSSGGSVLRTTVPREQIYEFLSTMAEGLAEINAE